MRMELREEEIQGSDMVRLLVQDSEMSEVQDLTEALVKLTSQTQKNQKKVGSGLFLEAQRTISPVTQPSLKEGRREEECIPLLCLRGIIKLQIQTI